MEIALPLIALGGLFVASNFKPVDTASASSRAPPASALDHRHPQPLEHLTSGSNAGAGVGAEGFHNLSGASVADGMGLGIANGLPNVTPLPENYPITNNAQLIDNIMEYPNPNNATDRYFNQNAYQLAERSGIDTGSNIPNIYSLSGNYLTSSEFVHNNMNPFNGGKPRGQIYNNNNAETIMDTYTGSGTQITKKLEQAPLFRPQDNVQRPYGMPATSDFFQSRQVPAMKNSMTKPFESIRVGPGLNQGYSANGSGGYNAGMEARDLWLPKTVDELRTVTNPKLEYNLDGLQGVAQSIVKNVGIEGRMEKNRPDRYYINTQDRWLTTTGVEQAGRVESEVVIKASTRNETAHHLQGSAAATIKTAASAPQVFQEPRRAVLDPTSVGTSTATRTAPFAMESLDMHRSSHHVPKTNRAECAQNQAPVFGASFSRAVGAALAPVMDVLRPNRRNDIECSVRMGNVATGAGGAPMGHTMNPAAPAQQLPTTNKETTLHASEGYVGNQANNGYLVASHAPISNQRDTTTCNDIGFAPMGGSANKQGAPLYDHAYRSTNKSNKENTLVGRTNMGNAKMFGMVY